MAPATTHEEEGEEGWGSRTRAGSLRRRSQSRAEPPAPSQRRSGRGAARERSTGSRAAGETRAAENSGRMTTRSTRASASASAASRKESKSRAGKEVAPRRSKRVKVAGDIEEEESENSSAVSSPLRAPYIPRAVDELGNDIVRPYLNMDPAVTDAYLTLRDKYSTKLCNQQKLVTLDVDVPCSSLDESIHESVQEMVLQVSRVVFGLSSYIDGNLLNRTSDFLIDWDKKSKIATILTSACLIRSKRTSWDEWSGTDEYAPHAEVRVRLLDKNGTPVIAELMHYHKHYNFAIYKLKIDLDAPIPSFSEVKFGQEIFVLGRDDKMNLIVDHGTVPYKGPSGFERNHYMFASCEATEVNQCILGGPIVDLGGQFLGMVNLPDLAFTPSDIIHKCLHMLKKFDCVPRLQTGMKFSSIRFLDLIHKEKVIRECGIGMGLIVTEVSEGSAAEKKGIRTGDIVECWNGESVSTTLELESLLLRMSEEHLDSGGRIGSNMDVTVGIFQVRKDSRKSKTLSLKVGDDAEVIARGKHDVYAAHCAMVSNDGLT